MKHIILSIVLIVGAVAFGKTRLKGPSGSYYSILDNPNSPQGFYLYPSRLMAFNSTLLQPNSIVEINENGEVIYSRQLPFKCLQGKDAKIDKNGNFYCIKVNSKGDPEALVRFKKDGELDADFSAIPWSASIYNYTISSTGFIAFVDGGVLSGGSLYIYDSSGKKAAFVASTGMAQDENFGHEIIADDFGHFFVPTSRRRYFIKYDSKGQRDPSYPLISADFILSYRGAFGTGVVFTGSDRSSCLIDPKTLQIVRCNRVLAMDSNGNYLKEVEKKIKTDPNLKIRDCAFDSKTSDLYILGQTKEIGKYLLQKVNVNSGEQTSREIAGNLDPGALHLLPSSEILIKGEVLNASGLATLLAKLNSDLTISDQLAFEPSILRPENLFYSHSMNRFFVYNVGTIFSFSSLDDITRVTEFSTGYVNSNFFEAGSNVFIEEDDHFISMDPNGSVIHIPAVAMRQKVECSNSRRTDFVFCSSLEGNEIYSYPDFKSQAKASAVRGATSVYADFSSDHFFLTLPQIFSGVFYGVALVAKIDINGNLDPNYQLQKLQYSGRDWRPEITRILPDPLEANAFFALGVNWDGRPYFVRLLPDGRLDQSFNFKLAAAVQDFAVLKDGSFVFVGNSLEHKIQFFKRNGSPNLAYKVEFGFVEPTITFRKVIENPLDGSIVVVGSFSIFENETHRGLVVIRR